MKKTVKLVLVENIGKLGLMGDQINAALGYARNYLLPKKLAVLSNDPKAADIISKVKAQREKLQAEIEKIKKLADKLKEETVIIKAKSGDAGKLFGSVTAEDVADKLGIEKKNLKMNPIRSLGEHEIEISLGYNIKAKTKIKVEAQKETKKDPSTKFGVNKSK